MSNLSAAQQAAIANLESGASALGLTIDEEARQDAIDQATLFDSEGSYIGGILPDTPASPVSPVSPASPPPPPDYYIKDKKEGNSYSIPSTKNLLGANLDVAQRLEKVEFEQYGDGSLKNAIAYIVPWQRAESNTQSAAQNASPSSPSLNFFAELIDGFSPDLGFDTEGTYDFGIDSSYVPKWNPDESLWNAEPIDLAFNTDLDFFQGDDRKGSFASDYYSNTFETGSNGEITLSQSEAEKRQASLSSEIPMGWKQGILSGGRFLADQLIQDSRTGSFVDTAILQASRLLKVPSGPVYVGNANGLINQILDYANIFGFNVPRGLTTSVAPDFQSKRSKIEAYQPGPEPTNGMWQFLFNPSELTLTAGPEFKKTETWGVSDEPNIGQPLHFTSYKNPELKFSKVLLNGYVFGKKVEDLQQGLFKLFLENPTNDAKHGPRVLEFVWGKRSFGPCVMKDISITEKMWDDGELVNAEVSFTLVKVPEWTINDGQVSTFDPTAIPPTAPPPTKTTPGEAKSEDEEEKTQPPAEPDTPEDILRKCRNIKSDKNLIAQAINKVNSSDLDGLEYNTGGFLGEIFRSGDRKYTPTFVSNLYNYKNIYKKYSLNNFYKQKIASIGATCIEAGKGEGPIIYNYEQAQKRTDITIGQKGIANESANREILKCYKKIEEIITAESKRNKCDKLPIADSVGSDFIGPVFL